MIFPSQRKRCVFSGSARADTSRGRAGLLTAFNMFPRLWILKLINLRRARRAWRAATARLSGAIPTALRNARHDSRPSTTFGRHPPTIPFSLIIKPQVDGLRFLRNPGYGRLVGVKRSRWAGFVALRLRKPRNSPWYKFRYEECRFERPQPLRPVTSIPQKMRYDPRKPFIPLSCVALRSRPLSS